MISVPGSSGHPHAPGASERLPVDLRVLEEIQRRVLWLAVRMVDAANHERDTGDGVKVGGHQASSTSLVTAMTALYFAHLDAGDRVSVKPHASPVFHAIQYLLGNLDRAYLTRLRARGGLQSYPSRTKDPDGVDFSTGSVGRGATAPLFAAVTRRYVDAHFGPRPRSRFVALIGDAELDEGNVWEAIADPVCAGLGTVLWVVDFNRQSLDRVVPGIRITQLRRQFEAAGWHVVEVKYGRRLRAKFAEPYGDALRRWIDDMPNERYQSLFGYQGPELRNRFLEEAPREVAKALENVRASDLAPLIQDLGGHDLASMIEAYRECDAVTDRPSVVFAYTIKGWGLPIAGNPRNHAALLTPEQIAELRSALGLTPETEWDAFPAESAAGRWCAERARVLRRPDPVPRLDITVPVQVERSSPKRPVSTQEAFGRLLSGLARDPGVAPYLVTTSPDVATSTNLAGFINKTGVFAPVELPGCPDSLLKWEPGPRGQHIELGISEMNLFSLLGQLGLAWDLSGQPLLPIGTVYDPFVCRGLDAFIYAAYSGARFVVAGTPSGVTLAPEGGAHQSTITASIGLELPGVTFVEPAYVRALDWLFCDALRGIAAGEAGAYYLRLTTRPIDQAPFEAALARLGEDELRRQVLAGGYRLVDASAVDGPEVYLAASGAVLPEVLAAAAELAEEGIAAHVVDVASLDRLYATWRRGLRDDLRAARRPRRPGILDELFGARAPVVTVHDAASHAMAWLGSALGVPCVPLGVDEFGQSGSVHELYELHDLLPGHIVNAALAALAL
ncbi:transketolase-like TK C-terminal-containing protein [Carbonactinospora thermoautotrophica]|uniref:transketolase-like TK C-terminal-containing protein n=1 Tax=Carbonactinospora thermoautotrophica TaxID=1469144 RepID=UPI003DAA2A82